MFLRRQKLRQEPRSLPEQLGCVVCACVNRCEDNAPWTYLKLPANPCTLELIHSAYFVSFQRVVSLHGKRQRRNERCSWTLVKEVKGV